MNSHSLSLSRSRISFAGLTLARLRTSQISARIGREFGCILSHFFEISPFLFPFCSDDREERYLQSSYRSNCWTNNESRSCFTAHSSISLSLSLFIIVRTGAQVLTTWLLHLVKPMGDYFIPTSPPSLSLLSTPHHLVPLYPLFSWTNLVFLLSSFVMDLSSTRSIVQSHFPLYLLHRIHSLPPSSLSFFCSTRGRVAILLPFSICFLFLGYAHFEFSSTLEFINFMRVPILIYARTIQY